MFQSSANEPTSSLAATINSGNRSAYQSHMLGTLRQLMDLPALDVQTNGTETLLVGVEEVEANKENTALVWLDNPSASVQLLHSWDPWTHGSVKPGELAVDLLSEAGADAFETAYSAHFASKFLDGTLVLSEPLVVRALLFLLHGTPSSLYTLDTHQMSFEATQPFRLQHMDTVSTANLVHHFVEAGTLVHRLRRLVRLLTTGPRASAMGATAQAFAWSVHKYLTHLDAYLVGVQALIVRDVGSLSLFQLLVRTRLVRQQLLQLAQICLLSDAQMGAKTTDVDAHVYENLPRGASLIDHVYSMCVQSDSDGLLLSLLIDTLQPYLVSLYRWIYHGQAASDEFVVGAHEEVTVHHDAFWDAGALDRGNQALPQFLQRVHAHIVTCGKAMQVLHSFDASHYMVRLSGEALPLRIALSTPQLHHLRQVRLRMLNRANYEAMRLELASQVAGVPLEQGTYKEMLEQAARRHQQRLRTSGHHQDVVRARQQEWMAQLQVQMQEQRERRMEAAQAARQEELAWLAEQSSQENLTVGPLARRTGTLADFETLKEQARQEMEAMYAEQTREANERIRRFEWRARRLDLQADRLALVFANKDEEMAYWQSESAPVKRAGGGFVWQPRWRAVGRGGGTDPTTTGEEDTGHVAWTEDGGDEPTNTDVVWESQEEAMEDSSAAEDSTTQAEGDVTWDDAAEDTEGSKAWAEPVFELPRVMDEQRVEEDDEAEEEDDVVELASLDGSDAESTASLSGIQVVDVIHVHEMEEGGENNAVDDDDILTVVTTASSSSAPSPMDMDVEWHRVNPLIVDQDGVRQKADTALPVALLLQHSIVDSILMQFHLSNAAVLRVFVRDLDVETHLQWLRKLYLMEAGLFADQLCSSLFGRLQQGTPWLSTDALNTQLQMALDTAGLAEDDHAQLFRFRVQPQEDSDKVDGQEAARYRVHDLAALDHLRLEYACSWPLTLVLDSSSMDAYNRVFSFLLRMKRATYVLRQIWVALQVAWQRSRASKAQLRRLQLFRHQMEHFVATMQGYIINQVIQVTWQRLVTRIQSSVRTLDDLRAAHADYVDELIFCCLLNPKAKVAMQMINSMLGFILQFEALTRRFVDDGSGLHEMHAIMQSFSKHSDFLFLVLTKLVAKSYQPHMEDLLLRLDFSGRKAAGSSSSAHSSSSSSAATGGKTRF